MKAIFQLLILFAATISYSQDPHFSQYQWTPIYYNPANAGLNCNIRAVVNYRQQWKSVVTPFSTMAFSYDMNTSKQKSKRASLGLGVQFLNDRSGDARMSLTQGTFNLSGILKLDETSILSVGLMGGFGQRSIDYSSLRWENQYQNGTYSSGNATGENLGSNSATYVDAGAGLLWTYGKEQGYITQNDGVKFNFGASVWHFNLPSTSYLSSTNEKLNTKLILHTSAELGKANTNLTFIPQVFFVQQGKMREVLIGNTFRYLLNEGSHFTGFVKSSAISLGVNYRLKDALITSVLLEYSNWSVGFSYDFTLSGLSAYNRSLGGFEVALKFSTPNPFAKVYRSRI